MNSIIKKGTLLFNVGFQSITNNSTMTDIKITCPDTAKRGLYFYTNILQVLQKCLDTNLSLTLNICTVNENFIVPNGKYTFRFKNARRYFVPYELQTRLIPNVIPTDEENISHIEHVSNTNYELFIISQIELSKLLFVKSLTITPNICDYLINDVITDEYTHSEICVLNQILEIINESKQTNKKRLASECNDFTQNNPKRTNN